MKLTYLVIHCTATPEGRAVTSAQIREMHKLRGWKQVGYSSMIHLDGTVELLVKHNTDNIVDPWEITNGVAGINSISRHVVYVGGLDKKGVTPKDTRTLEQLRSMEKFVKQTVTLHPDILIAGHNQFANKACPSFDTVQWLKSIGIASKNIYKA